MLVPSQLCTFTSAKYSKKGNIPQLYVNESGIGITINKKKVAHKHTQSFNNPWCKITCLAISWIVTHHIHLLWLLIMSSTSQQHERVFLVSVNLSCNYCKHWTWDPWLFCVHVTMQVDTVRFFHRKKKYVHHTLCYLAYWVTDSQTEKVNILFVCLTWLTLLTGNHQSHMPGKQKGKTEKVYQHL